MVTKSSLRQLVPLALTIAVFAGSHSSAWGQAGLRESLEKLDVNNNGLIEADEVTPLARPYLERVILGRSRRVEDPFRRPMRIDKIQESARIYYALKNGVSGERVISEPENMIRGFEPDRDENLVPGFGIGEIKYPYTRSDIEEAQDTMGRWDRNNDGFIDRGEARRGRWTHRNPFDDDLNGDDRLSLMEFTQRYARRRLLQGDAEELVRRAWRTGGEIESSVKNEKTDESQWWKRGGSDYWLTAALLGRFDKDRNGTLDVEEAGRTGLPVAGLDKDGDGRLTREELFPLVAEMQAEAGDVTDGLPGWFFELDENRDGQVAMHEFAEEWSLAKREEFQQLDINGDGLLTDKEVLQAASVTGGDYRNEVAEVLPPKRSIISEIEVEDDYPIKDLNLEISITHTSVGSLDAFLTGPDGERVELFTEIGGSGDHFSKTILDDQASTPIVKARPPYEGRFRPEAIDKRQPGLGVFNGKSVQGVWQLVIRGTRSDRFGMLHSWSLQVAPEDDDKVATTRRSPRSDADNEADEKSDEGDRTDEGRGKDSKDKPNDSKTKEKSSGGLLDLLNKSPF